jgi:hypothetical protein
MCLGIGRFGFEGVVELNNEIFYSVFREISDTSAGDWEEIADSLLVTEFTDNSEDIDFIDRRCYTVQASTLILDSLYIGPLSDAVCARTNSCSGQDGESCWEDEFCAQEDSCGECTGGDTGLIADYMQDLCGECGGSNACVGCMDVGAINNGSFTLDCEECGDNTEGNCLA